MCSLARLIFIDSSSSTKGFSDMNTLEISSSTIPLLMPCIDELCSNFSLVLTGSDVGNDVDIKRCPEDLDRRLIDALIRFSLLTDRFC